MDDVPPEGEAEAHAAQREDAADVQPGLRDEEGDDAEPVDEGRLDDSIDALGEREDEKGPHREAEGERPAGELKALEPLHEPVDVRRVLGDTRALDDRDEDRIQHHRRAVVEDGLPVEDSPNALVCAEVPEDRERCHRVSRADDRAVEKACRKGPLRVHSGLYEEAGERRREEHAGEGEAEYLPPHALEDGRVAVEGGLEDEHREEDVEEEARRHGVDGLDEGLEGWAYIGERPAGGTEEEERDGEGDAGLRGFEHAGGEEDGADEEEEVGVVLVGVGRKGACRHGGGSGGHGWV